MKFTMYPTDKGDSREYFRQETNIIIFVSQKVTWSIKEDGLVLKEG